MIDPLWDEKFYEWCKGCSSFYPTGYFSNSKHRKCNGYYQEYCKPHILKLEAVKTYIEDHPVSTICCSKEIMKILEGKVLHEVD